MPNDNKKLIKTILSDYWPLFLIIIVAGFLILFRLNRDLLNDWDECVYAQYAVEMKNTGNLFNNQWNSGMVFEKPPLNTILMQMPLLLGVNEFNARITMSVFMLLLIIFLYIFTKKYYSQSIAILSSLILLSSNLFIVFGTRVNTDMGFTLFTFLGFFFWILSYKKNTFSYLSGIFFGLAVLNKGLSVAPYLLAIFLSLFLNFKKETFINYLKLIGTFIVVILPWHVFEYIKYGNNFLQVYFFEHILKRASNSLDFHFEGRLFYIKQIYANLFPWIFFTLSVPLLNIPNIRNLFNFKKLIAVLKNNIPIFTIILFILVPFTSITLAKTRIAWYALPIYPFLAIFIAYSINYLFYRLKIGKLIFIIILVLTIDSIYLINKEVKITVSKKEITRRNDIFIRAKDYPNKEIDYLVWVPERQAKDVLPKNMQTSTTFIYGGNPCAVYYSAKKINYYFSLDDFKKRITKKNGLYVIENGDSAIIKDLPIKVLYNNIDYTLFEN